MQLNLPFCSDEQLKVGPVPRICVSTAFFFFFFFDATDYLMGNCTREFGL